MQRNSKSFDCDGSNFCSREQVTLGDLEPEVLAGLLCCLPTENLGCRVTMLLYFVESEKLLLMHYFVQ